METPHLPSILKSVPATPDGKRSKNFKNPWLMFMVVATTVEEVNAGHGRVTSPEEYVFLFPETLALTQVVGHPSTSVLWTVNMTYRIHVVLWLNWGQTAIACSLLVIVS